MNKFKVGDKVICTHPTIVMSEFKGVEGTVEEILPKSGGGGEDRVRILYGDCRQTAWVVDDGVELVEQQKTPTEQTAGATEGGYDLSEYAETDQVNSPSHYGQGKIEAIEYIEDMLSREEFIGYLRGNISKYLHRFRYKGKVLEDLRKAEWYLKRLISTMEKE